MVDVVRKVWEVSIRMACQVLLAERSTYHYCSMPTGQAARWPKPHRYLAVRL
jgi:hypothetical protein